MATQWSNPAYVDGDFTAAQPIGIPVFQSPIDATTAGYVFTQEFMQQLEFFEETPLNTAHDSAGLVPDYSDYFLVKEGPRQDIRGGLVKWTRTYARVPDAYDDFQSYSYPFIGFLGQLGIVFNSSTGNTTLGAAITGRSRKPRIVQSRLRHEFFKTGPGAPYARAGDIPVIQSQLYTVASTGGVQPIDVDVIWDAFSSFPSTNPSRATYEGWMSQARSLSWSAAVGNGQFVAEDSKIDRWMGTIFQRTTRYVLAV